MIEKRLIDTLNHLFPPRASYAAKSSSVDGYGYEPQADGSFKIYDSEGNEIAIVWRDEDGNVTGYDDLANGQCVEVPEDGYYYAEDGSCNPEEQSCWFYHDDTSQMQNASQRFAEEAPASTTSEQQTTSTKPKKSQRSPDVTEDHSSDGITAPSHDVGTSHRSSGTLATVETAEPEVHQGYSIPADADQGKMAGAPVMLMSRGEVLQSEQDSQTAHPVAHDCEIAIAVSQGASILRSALGMSSDEPGVMPDILSEILEVLAPDGEIRSWIAGVETPMMAPEAPGDDVPEPVFDPNVSSETAPEVAHVQAVAGDPVVQEASFAPETVRISEPGASPLSMDTAGEGMEFTFIGSPMFFMPSSDGAPLAAVMSANQRAEHEVHNVGARGNSPDHQDGQGSSGRDDSHDESEDEEEETIPV